MWWNRPYLWVFAALAVVLGVRALGPSDVYPDQEQTRAMAQAADVALAGRWLMPRDAAGELPLRPPLVAHLAAIGPAAGLWGTFAFKLPCALAAAGMVGLTWLMAGRFARRLARQMRRSFDERGATWTAPRLAAVAALAAVAVVANPAFVRYAYQVRVEMVSAGILTLAWAAATVALAPGTRRRMAAAGSFWIAVALAALAQGWIAMLPMAYAALAARLVHGRWSVLHRLGWTWGVPLAAVVAGAWYVPAVIGYPGQVLTVMLPAAAAERLSGGDGWWGVLLVPQRMASWLVERYFPWSVAAVVALVWMGPRRWLRSPLAPAILWLGVLAVAYLPLPGKGAGDLLAGLPPLACIAVLFFVMDQSRWPVPAWLVGAVATGMIVAVCSREVTFSSTAWEGQGVTVAAFARDARSIVGDDAVAFGPGARQTPVASLMGRHPQIGTGPPAWTVQLVETLPAAARVASGPIRTSAGPERRLVLAPVAP